MPRETTLLVANYESDVGYAWWLMENFWRVIAESSPGRACLLVYPKIGVIPEAVATAPIETIEFRFSCRSWDDMRAGLALIRRRRVTSIYLTDWPYLHPVFLLWRLAGVRRIVLHDHTPGDRPAVSGVRGLLKAALHAAQVFSATSYVAVSSYISRRLQENCKVPERKCIVVTNGIRPFDPEATRRPAVRAALGVPDHAILIVMVSRATAYKGLDFAVRVFTGLLQDPATRERVYAVHCGDGPDLARFEQATRQAGIDGRVRFLGRRGDVREILGAADIAFHPSRGEAMSLSVLEFMCAGLAVVTSDLPSVSTALEPGVTGLTYRREDAADAVAVLRRVIDDEGLRRSLGSAAAEACRQHYTLDAMNATFVERVLPAL